MSQPPTSPSPAALVAIIGSLRTDSFQRAVFDGTQSLLPQGVTLTEVPLRDVPFYDGDAEQQGDPGPVTHLKETVDAADGLVVFTPEYNRSVPAVTKNAIDWLSRMPGDSVLSRSTVGIVAATPGGHDASGVRDHLGISVAANRARLFGPSLGIASIADKLTDGALTDATTKNRLAEWFSGFSAFVREDSAD